MGFSVGGLVREHDSVLDAIEGGSSYVHEALKRDEAIEIVVRDVDLFFDDPDRVKTKFYETSRSNPYGAYLKLVKDFESAFVLDRAKEVYEGSETIFGRLDPIASYKQAAIEGLVARHQLMVRFFGGFTEDGAFAHYLKFQRTIPGKEPNLIKAEINSAKIRALATHTVLFLSTFPNKELRELDPNFYQTLSVMNSQLVQLAIEDPNMVEAAFSDAREVLVSKRRAALQKDTKSQELLELVNEEESNLALLKTGLNAEVFFFHTLKGLVDRLDVATLNPKSYPVLTEALSRSRKVALIDKADTEWDTEMNTDWVLIRESRDTVKGVPSRFVLGAFDVQTESRPDPDLRVTLIYKKDKDAVGIEGDEDEHSLFGDFNTGGTQRNVLRAVKERGQPVIVIKVPTSIVGPGAKLATLGAEAEGRLVENHDTILYSIERALAKTKALYPDFF